MEHLLKVLLTIVFFVTVILVAFGLSYSIFRPLQKSTPFRCGKSTLLPCLFRLLDLESFYCVNKHFLVLSKSGKTNEVDDYDHGFKCRKR